MQTKPTARRQAPVPLALLEKHLNPVAQFPYTASKKAGGARAYHAQQCKDALAAVNQPAGKRGSEVISAAEFEAARDSLRDNGAREMLHVAYHLAHADFNASSRERGAIPLRDRLHWGTSGWDKTVSKVLYDDGAALGFSWSKRDGHELERVADLLRVDWTRDAFWENSLTYSPIGSHDLVAIHVSDVELTKDNRLRVRGTATYGDVRVINTVITGPEKRFESLLPLDAKDASGILNRKELPAPFDAIASTLRTD